MRRATLLYNPLAGRHTDRRVKDIESAASVLRAGGIEVVLEPTQGAATTVGQVHQAITRGYDAIFACGGDGTIHDVLQGLVGTDVALGIIPLGTGNTLAHDLQLPLSPVGAAKAVLKGKTKRIAVGKVNYLNLAGNPAERFFIVAAGVGLDARLFYQLNATVKKRLGMSAYYAVAWQLWFRRQVAYFEAICDGKPQVHTLTQLLAVRIRNFGGVLRELAPGASLDRNDFRLVLCHTKSRLAFLSYVVRGILGTNWKVKGIESMPGSVVSCRYPGPLNEEHKRVYLEADGELLGTIPAQITVVPNALSLLVADC
jgi:diacylglycerol kinase (ATP)